jgi:hypothetical protein
LTPELLTGAMARVLIHLGRSSRHKLACSPLLTRRKGPRFDFSHSALAFYKSTIYSNIQEQSNNELSDLTRSAASC